MKNIKLKSFCKINLSLRVIKKLNNNYHLIQSLVTFGKIYDEINLKEIKSNKDIIVFRGHFKKGISIKNNSITKTFDTLRANNYIKKKFFKIIITKNIPTQAGLGGGSMNASTLINFIIKYYKIRINKKKLANIMLNIGSDVILGLEAKNILLKDLKKTITTNRNLNFYMLLVKPNIDCSTKLIFTQNKSFSKPYKVKKNSINVFFEIESLKNDRNDLEKVVFKMYPRIKRLCNLIENQKQCEFSRMTGSGSVCIGYFKSLKFAKKARQSIKYYFPNYWSRISKAI